MAADDAEDGRQSEPAACELDAEERVEDPAQRLLVHADAGVLHFEVGVGARLHLRAEVGLRQIVLLAKHEASRDGDRAFLAAEGFRGVGGEVQNDLPKLRAIRFHRRQIIGQVEAEHRLLRHRGPQQLGHLFDDRRQRDRLDYELAFARIGEQLLGEFGGLARRRDHILHVAVGHRARRQRAQGEVGIAEDALQQIVEVVSDTPSEHTEALELLRMQYLLLELLALCLGFLLLGDVLRRPDQARRAAIGVTMDPRRTTDVPHAAVRPNDAMLDGVRKVGVQGSIDGVVEGLAVVRVNQSAISLVSRVERPPIDPEYVVQFVGPDDAIGHDVPLPAADLRDALRLPKAGIASLYGLEQTHIGQCLREARSHQQQSVLIFLGYAIDIRAGAVQRAETFPLEDERDEEFGSQPDPQQFGIGGVLRLFGVEVGAVSRLAVANDFGEHGVIEGNILIDPDGFAVGHGPQQPEPAALVIEQGHRGVRNFQPLLDEAQGGADDA